MIDYSLKNLNMPLKKVFAKMKSLKKVALFNDFFSMSIYLTSLFNLKYYWYDELDLEISKIGQKFTQQSMQFLDLKLKKFKIKRILTYIYPFTKSLNNRKLDLWLCRKALQSYQRSLSISYLELSLFWMKNAISNLVHLLILLFIFIFLINFLI